jgi:hypothetical protein
MGARCRPDKDAPGVLTFGECVRIPSPGDVQPGQTHIYILNMTLSAHLELD